MKGRDEMEYVYAHSTADDREMTFTKSYSAVC
jgi:hypothetical protein